MAKVALDNELVRAFVGAAHADLSKVQALLEQEPGLLHASMNWGGDDWETALGAASHVGRRDIAEWLLANGARIDLFAATMLGNLEFVQTTLTKYPHMINAAGPHGIPLMQHALMGGEQAKEVLNYLRSLTGTEESGNMILVENRIEVKAGFGEAVLERFRSPKSVHTFPGFVRMDVLHATNAEGNEEIRVCTTWEQESDFQAWAHSDSFRHAHAKRAEAAASAEHVDVHQSPTSSAHGHSHGSKEAIASSGHGSHPSNEAAAANGPIIGNKVTIYQVVASHHK